LKHSTQELENELGVVAHICNDNYSGDGDRRMESSRPAWAKVVRLISETKYKIKRIGGMAQVVEHLPTALQVFGLIPSIEKKKVGK
jgi:hypothetical protein